MGLKEALNKLEKPFCIELNSQKVDFKSITIEAIKIFLRKPKFEVVCVPFRDSSREIQNTIKQRMDVWRLFFVDAISILEDYRMPEGNFRAVYHPDLIDDI